MIRKAMILLASSALAAAVSLPGAAARAEETKPDFVHPDSLTCAKVVGVTVDLVERYSQQFNWSPGTVTYLHMNGCSVLLDTPDGVRSCGIGGLVKMPNGDLLATSYFRLVSGQLKRIGACIASN